MASTVLGVPITHRSIEATLDEVRRRGSEGRGGYACFASVYMVMLAHDDADFRGILEGAEIVVPDGAPVAWTLRTNGHPGTEHLPGVRVTEEVLAMAERDGLRVGFYGASDEVLRTLLERVSATWPRLEVTYSHSPPFRPWTAAEVDEDVAAIKEAGVQILFVGLGCPKQERWMAAQRERLPAVMLGVGAAFEFLAGTKPRAPVVLQRAGLEWLFRLGLEPRRLFWRYAINNPRFVWRLFRERVVDR